MNTFLETHNLPRLNQKEMENQNRQIISKEIALVIKKLPKQKTPGPDDFIGESYQTFKEEVTSILLKLLQNIKEKGTLPNAF